MTKTPNGERVDRVAETMERTTAAIVDAIAAGIADPAAWRAPWHHAEPDAFTPTNIATGAPYTGGNRIALYLTGAPDQRWGTFNQWRDAGHPVPKGCRAAAYILRPMSRSWEDAETGETRTKITGWRAHAVWNAVQVGCPPIETETEPTGATDRPDADDIADAFRWAIDIGAKVIASPSAGASYSPTFDQITMPAPNRWDDGHAAWSTMAHEATHWTGHESRLARTFGKRFGDDAYAAEELCAELGAAFTLAAMGRSTEPRPDHAHYLAHWLRVLNSAPDALWTVASRAERAATYLADRTVAATVAA